MSSKENTQASGSSPAVSRAKTSRSQGKGKASTTKTAIPRGVVFGLPCKRQLGYYDPSSSSLKTLVLSLFADSTPSLHRLPRSGMMLSGRIYAQATWVRRTKEKGYGLLRTPDANMERGDRTKENLQGRLDRGMPLNLNDQLKAIDYQLLPTPTGQEVEHPQMELTQTGRRKTKSGDSSHSMNLADTIQLLPTPASRDYKGGNSKTEEKGRNPMTNNLSDAIEVGTNTGWKLQPGFVEWMMGYPEGWTDLKASVTPLSLISR